MNSTTVAVALLAASLVARLWLAALDAPGTNLPESFFTWYGYMEQDRALSVPLGGESERRYDVWRCGRSVDGWIDTQ